MQKTTWNREKISPKLTWHLLYQEAIRKRTGQFSDHPFSGAILVLGRVVVVPRLFSFFAKRLEDWTALNDASSLIFANDRKAGPCEGQILMIVRIF